LAGLILGLRLLWKKIGLKAQIIFTNAYHQHCRHFLLASLPATLPHPWAAMLREHGMTDR
jgi:hypothetical protein